MASKDFTFSDGEGAGFAVSSLEQEIKNNAANVNVRYFFAINNFIS